MDDLTNFSDDIKKAVGEKKYDRAMKAIKDSITPQFTAYLFLTNGLQNKKKGRSLGCVCKDDIQSSSLIQISTSWANRMDFLMKEPLDTNSEIYKIEQFLDIRGNPYSYFDLFRLSQTEDSFFNPELILNYICQVGWHRGLNRQKIFAEVSNMDFNGVQDDRYKIDISYKRYKYPIGFPRCSGQSKKDSKLFNSIWTCCRKDEEEDENSKAISIAQVTEEMENIEDDNNQLDCEIVRNRNVHRLLLFGGPKALQASQIAAAELNAIYGCKGDIILSLIEDEDVSNELYPVLLRRLKDRAMKLYLRKIDEQQAWSNKLERAITIQRTVYQKEKIEPISYLEAKEINYSTKDVYLLEKFIQIYSQNDVSSNSIEFRKIINNLRSSSILDIKLTYYRALSLYSGALFLNELLSADIIDPIESSSVKLAIETGMSGIEKHGHFNILKLLAEALRKHKKPKLDTAVNEISGLFFNIDNEKSTQIATVGALFLKALTDIEKETEKETSFINCKVGNGLVSLSLTSGIPFEFDLSTYKYV